MTTRPAWVPLNLGLNARQSGCVEFFVNADTLYDGYVTFDGRTVGYLQDWGSDGCLFIPCITMCEDEHPRPLEADSIDDLYELVHEEVMFMDKNGNYIQGNP